MLTIELMTLLYPVISFLVLPSEGCENKRFALLDSDRHLPCTRNISAIFDILYYISVLLIYSCCSSAFEIL